MASSDFGTAVGRGVVNDDDMGRDAAQSFGKGREATIEKIRRLPRHDADVRLHEPGTVAEQ